MKALEIGDIEIILYALEETVHKANLARDRLGILLMHDVGLRVFEACSVERSDFTSDLKLLNVRGAIAKWRRDTPEDDEVVSVSARTRAAIDAYMWERPDLPGPMLRTRTGGTVHPHHYNQLLARVGKRYLHRHIHPHMLRHSCGTVIVCDKQLPLPVGKKQLRHRNISTTDKYLGVRPPWADDVAEAFG